MYNMASWIVSRYCDQRCSHCYPMSDTAQIIPDVSFVWSILKKLQEINVSIVFVSGGEPLLLPFIFDLCSAIRTIGAVPHLCTNGLLMTKEIAADLLNAGVTWVSVSLEGDRDTEHDIVRGKGSFRNAIRGIEAAADAGLHVLVDFTASGINYHRLSHVIDLFLKSPASAIKIRRCLPLGRAIASEAFQINDLLGYSEMLHDVLVRLEDQSLHATLHDPPVTAYLLQRHKRWRFPNSYVSLVGCHALHRWFGIMPNADIVICPLVPIVAGNLLCDETSYVLSRLMRLRKIYLSTCDCQKACSLSARCGGCCATALLKTGDWTSCDPDCLLVGNQRQSPSAISYE